MDQQQQELRATVQQAQDQVAALLTPPADTSAQATPAAIPASELPSRTAPVAAPASLADLNREFLDRIKDAFDSTEMSELANELEAHICAGATTCAGQHFKYTNVALNAHSVPQWQVEHASADFCGSCGCSGGFVLRVSGVWQIVAAYDCSGISVMPSETDGVRDLDVRTQPGMELVGKWKGGSYALLSK